MIYSSDRIPGYINNENEECFAIGKRAISTTRGNIHKLSGKKKKSRSKTEKEEAETEELMNELKIIHDIEGLSFCCGYGGSLGCLQRAFSEENSVTYCLEVNLPSLCKVVKECRLSVQSKAHNDDLYNFYISNLFTQSVERVKEVSNGTKQFVMDYKILNRRVCKKAFAATYGILVKHLEKISHHLKSFIVDLEIPSAQNYYKSAHRPYRDSDLPDYNYCEVEKIFQENLKTAFIGNFF
jgi:hypothetical protein